ncbi:MAG: hypothetical protein AMXMBFR64_19210 [Myxococcales bacterium]
MSGELTPEEERRAALAFRRIVVPGADGAPVDLLPGWGAVLTGEAARRLGDAAREAAKDQALFDALLHGVPAPWREQPWRANFDDYFQARAAVTELPRMLAGLLLKPVAGAAYRVVDAIPPFVRRPFDRAVGILLDAAVNLPGRLLPHAALDPGALPGDVDLELPAYPQMRNACGETMLATWLKAHGVPVALAEPDTQLSFYTGSGLLQEEELRRRGFSLVSGPGTLDDLRAYLAHGHPVLVEVGWEGGGGHFAVVRGYDDERREVVVDSYLADGQVARVPYDRFHADWERRQRRMTVVWPQRDRRLDALRAAGRVSRDAEIQEGLSISDVWLTRNLEMFLELAWRLRGTRDDLIIRLNLNTSERAIEELLGGSIRWTHTLPDDTRLELYLEKVSVKGPGDAESARALLQNLASYLALRTEALSLRLGYERGAFQAEVQAGLDGALAGVGLEARLSVQPDGAWSVFVGLSGSV